MNITIKTTNMELTDAIRDFVHKRMEGLDKIMGNPEGELIMHIEVGKISNHHKTGEIYRAEARTNFCGNSLYVISELSNLYSAIDEMKDKMVAEAKKTKGKKRSFIRNIFRK